MLSLDCVGAVDDKTPALSVHIGEGKIGGGVVGSGERLQKQGQMNDADVPRARSSLGLRCEHISLAALVQPGDVCTLGLPRKCQNYDEGQS